MSDYLQEAIDGFKINDVPYSELFKTIIVHYLLGEKNNPYALRRTNVIINSSSELAEKSQEDHLRVLQAYIRYLDRNNTFLDLIINTFIEADYPDLFRGEVKIQDNGDSPDFNDSKNTLTSEDTNPSNITWIINQAAVNILIPNKEVKEFFEKIYNKDPLEDKWNKVFALCRAELFGRISKVNRSFEEKQNEWNKLASIQAILMYYLYTSVITSNEQNKSLSCSVLVQQNKKNSSNNDDSEITVAIFCPSIEESVRGHSYITQDNVKNYILHKFNGIFQTIDQTRNFSEDAPESEIHKCLKLEGSISQYFQEEIRKNIYRVNFKLPTFVTDWVILLTSFLLFQKHEGKILNFFLICGELSEFEDSQNTIFRRVEGLENLGTPSPLGELENIIKSAEKKARQIAKEHYPWFENGRYALFWNTASQEKYPIGLISIERSSWEKLIQDRFQNKLSIMIPNCLVGYVYGNPQIAGILEVCNEERNTDERKIKVAKELLRWQNNQWKSMMNEERENKLRDLLNEELKIQQSDSDYLLDDIVKIALRISDEPDKGGTIIFIDEKDDLSQFKSMGIPWKPIGNLTKDDVIALIAQDGAVLCPLIINKNNQSPNIKSWNDWDYRKLLIPSNEAKAFFDETEKYYKRQNREWPLNSKGSRRWSAAMAAFHPSIQTVIVISQDGDMHIWSVDNERRRVRMKEILIQEEGKEFVDVIPSSNKLVQDN